MKLQHFIRKPWSLVKPCSPLWGSSAKGIGLVPWCGETGEPLPPLAGDQGMGVPSPPAQRGSPQDTGVLSPHVLPAWGSILPGLPAPLPAALPSRTAARYRSSLQGAETGAGCFLHDQGFPRAPATPRQRSPWTQPGSRCRGAEANACNTFESEVKEQLRGSSVAVCQVMQAALS